MAKRRPFTPSEQLVGRPLPKDASYRDQLLAGHLKEDGTPCGRMTPGDRWLTAAHRDLRKSGLIRSGSRVSLEGGRPADVWYLTERGLEAARAAKARVSSAREARSAWSRDFLEARRAAMTAERAEREEAPSDLEPDPDPC
jgi:hypothetical protein